MEIGHPDDGVREGIDRWPSLVGWFAHETCERIGDFARQMPACAISDLMEGRGRRPEMGHLYIDGGAGVGSEARDELEGHDAQCVLIRCRLCRAANLLRGHICWRTRSHSGHRDIRSFEGLGDAEVAQDGNTIHIHENVGWLHIPVNNVDLVCTLQGACDLLDDPQDLEKLEGSFLIEQFTQRAPLDPRHHCIHAVTADPGSHLWNDVPMGEIPGDGRLSQKARLCFPVAENLLDRHQSMAAFFQCEQHSSGCTSPANAQHAIAPLQ